MGFGKVRYRVACSYDTETTNLKTDGGWVAYPVLFIAEDLRDVSISDYVPECAPVHLYRHEDDMLAYIDELVRWGHDEGVVPIVIMYNAIFDMHPLMERLAEVYEMRTLARSSTTIYTLDLYDDCSDDTPCLRFWDMWHFELNGLDAMGRTCGVKKQLGSWDYTKVRTPDTPLTDAERRYASYDVHIPPAYLRYLLESNAWMTLDDLGTNVLTKTSLVRCMAQREIGGKSAGKSTLYKSWKSFCRHEYFRYYNQYVLQRACFMGGLTFTSANYAHTNMHNVFSFDAISMHHAFINGVMLPVAFRKADADALQHVCESIVATPLSHVLEHYERPWNHAIHAAVRFEGLRPRSGSCFERFGIGLRPQSKFSLKSQQYTYESGSPAGGVCDAEVEARKLHRDSAISPTFAFGKLMSADVCVCHVSERELYAMSRVYEWDDMRALYGEISLKAVRPPAYVSLQSNVLYQRKNDMKIINHSYVEGQPYERDIPDSVPEGIAEGLRSGILTRQFIESYYSGTVKGQYNGIYGVQAQNVLQTGYRCINGDLEVDPGTRVTKETFADMSPEAPKTDYAYGLRIVGGSRLHLVLAIELASQVEGAIITGGDTDSFMVSVDDQSRILAALAPLHDAITASLSRCQEHIHRGWPEMAAMLAGVGTFECKNNDAYINHVELWNKARVSEDSTRKIHVTCAGMSRPQGLYTIVDAIGELTHERGMSFGDAVSTCLGYNVQVGHGVSHALEHTHPSAADTVDMDVRDYLDVVSHVHAHQSMALYAVPRRVGDTSKRTNALSLAWLERQGRAVPSMVRTVDYVDGGLVYDAMV